MGAEVLLPEEEGGVSGDMSGSWPSDTIVHFDAFCDAFRAWQASTESLDFLQQNEYAATLLSASNIRPLRLVSASERARHRCGDEQIDNDKADEELLPTAHSKTVASHASLALLVHAPCCERTVALTEDERLTLAQIPRVFPSQTAAAKSASASSAASAAGVSDGLASHCTALSRQQHAVHGLLSRSHKAGCPWREPTSPSLKGASLGSREAVCSVRQLLLGGPSLALTDSALVRAFCAAVVVQNAPGAADAGGRPRCLLPRGTPPSVVRAWMEDAVHALETESPSPSTDANSDSAADESVVTGVPVLRYAGSSVNERILQLLFSPKKRPRQEHDGGAAGAAAAPAANTVTGEVVMEYVGLLMSLYGYTVAVNDGSDEESEPVPSSSSAKPSQGMNNEEEGEEGVEVEKPPAVQWGGPAHVVSATESRHGNTVTRTEVTQRQGSYSVESAFAMLGRRMACRYCAHTPVVSAMLTEVTQTTTATTTTMVTVETSQSGSVTVVGGAAGHHGAPCAANKGEEVSAAEVEVPEAAHEEDQRVAQLEGGEESGEAQDVEESAPGAEREEDEDNLQDNVSGGGSEGMAGSHAASDGSVHSEGGVDEEQSAMAENEGGEGSEEVTPNTATADAVAAAVAPQSERHDASVVKPESTVQQAAAPVRRSPDAITTITKAVVSTTSDVRAESTTTITVTFASRSGLQGGVGHRSSCPWHRLFLSDAVGATPMTPTERCMDFTWTLDATEQQEREDDDGAHPQLARREGATTAASQGDASHSDLVVTGTAATLHEASRAAHHSQDASPAVAAEANVESAHEATHRTVLVLRFFSAEVERLITAWRLSEDWERTRPAQYLQHPLWRTWGTAGVLHPVRTEAADGAMEQYLRGLERRLVSRQERDVAAKVGGGCGDGAVGGGADEGDDESESSVTQLPLASLLGPERELAMSIGAPLYYAATGAAASSTNAFDGALRLANASLPQCFASDAADLAGRHCEKATAQSLLATALRAMTALAPPRQAAPAAADSTRDSDGRAVREGAAELAADSAASLDGFLATVQQRYRGEQTLENDFDLLRLRESMFHDAVPRVLQPYLAPHYCTLRPSSANAAEAGVAAGGDASSSRPSFVIEASASSAAPVKAAAAAASTASVLYPMTGADRAAVTTHLQGLRRIAQEEQLQQQRAAEAEAQRAAAVAAAASAAAAAAQTQAQAQARQGTAPSPAPKAAAAVTQGPRRTGPPAASSPPHGHAGGGGIQARHSPAVAPLPTSGGAPQHHGGVDGGSAGHHGHPFSSGHADGWSAPAGIPVSRSPAPPPVFGSFDTRTSQQQQQQRGDPHSFSATPAILGHGGSQGGLLDDAGGVLSGNFPFGWSPLAAGAEGGSGGSMDGGGGVLSSGGPGSFYNSPSPSNINAVGASSSSSPPRPVFAGGFDGGRMSDDRPQRGTSVLGSMNAGNASVLSSTGSGEEVRLSNWSTASTAPLPPSPTSASVGGGGVLQGGEGGVLAQPAVLSSTATAAASAGGGGGGGGSASSGARPGVPPPSSNNASSGMQGRGGGHPRRGGGGGGGRPPGPMAHGGGGGGGGSAPGLHSQGRDQPSSNAGRAVLDGGGAGHGPSSSNRGPGRARGRGGAPWRGGGGRGGFGRGRN